MRPSALSLRTSRLNTSVSRPSDAARSGARTAGRSAMSCSTVAVHGPRVLALSSFASRARIAATSSSVRSSSSRSATRSSGPSQCSSMRYRSPSPNSASCAAQRGDAVEPGTRRVGLRELRLVDDAHAVDHEVAAREPHPSTGLGVRTVPLPERERDRPVGQTRPVLLLEQQGSPRVRPRSPLPAPGS